MSIIYKGNRDTKFRELLAAAIDCLGNAEITNYAEISNQIYTAYTDKEITPSQYNHLVEILD